MAENQNNTPESNDFGRLPGVLEVDGKTIEFPPVQATCGDQGIDVSKLRNQTGLVALDPGFSTTCLLYTSPSPRDLSTSRMPSSA